MLCYSCSIHTFFSLPPKRLDKNKNKNKLLEKKSLHPIKA